MLTHQQIVNAVSKFVTKFQLKHVSYFGSYADGNATEQSDLDLLVEFTDRASISLLDIIHLQHNLEDELSIKVDVVEIPLPKKARVKIGKTVSVYGSPPAILAAISTGRQIRRDERDETLLHIIKDEAEVLREMTDGYDLHIFLDNELRKRATLMVLIKIGEATKSVSDEVKFANREINWNFIANLRNIAAYEYEPLNMSQIWSVATDDIPELLECVNGIRLSKEAELSKQNVNWGTSMISTVQKSHLKSAGSVCTNVDDTHTNKTLTTGERNEPDK